MPISSPSTIELNTTWVSRGRRAICRDARSTAATLSKRRAAASIRCPPCSWIRPVLCSKPRRASWAITRFRRRARSSRARTRGARPAPIAASARRSAAMSARSRPSSSRSCPKPIEPATSESSPARCAIASTATTAGGSPVSRITGRTARRIPLKPTSSFLLRSSTTTCACCCCRRPRSSRTASPIRAATWAST